MTQHEYRLDMDMMFAIHDALRRDLVQVARIAKVPGDCPGKALHAVRGWEIFKKFLKVHHAAEDEALWPALRARAAAGPDALALVAALEDEHTALDPLLAAADAAADATAADPGDRRDLAGIIDELVTAVTAHLAHEEAGGLALIDALLTNEEWMYFAKVQRERVGDDRVLYVPWLLEEASQQTIAFLDDAFPAAFLAANRSQWGPGYAALNRWDPTAECAS